MGRARGLIAVWEQTRRKEEMRLRRGGIWIPMSETAGQDRVTTLAWLCEEPTCNAVRAPGPILSSKEEEEGGD